MLKIRLRRMGARHRPFYRVVVSESTKVPTGTFVENLGHYDPMQRPAVYQLNVERIRHWMEKGAQPTERVLRLMKAQKRREEAGVAASGPEAAAGEGQPPSAEAGAAAGPESTSEAKDESGEGGPVGG